MLQVLNSFVKIVVGETVMHGTGVDKIFVEQIVVDKIVIVKVEISVDWKRFKVW